MVEELVFLGALVVHIAHEVDLGALGVPVDQCVDAADGAQDAVKLAAGQAEAQQVDRLEFDPPLLEPPLGLFRVKAFFLSEKLNIHRISSAFWVPAAAQTHGVARRSVKSVPSSVYQPRKISPSSEVASKAGS